MSNQNNWYRHVFLRRGPRHQIAWIPEELANRGKYVRIGEKDGWMVVAVWTRQRGTPDVHNTESMFPSIDR